MPKSDNPSAVILWRARLEQILRAQVEQDRGGKTLVINNFSPSPGGCYGHDVTILTDLQRGKYAMVPVERNLPRIQTVDVLQRGLQMLYPEVASVRHYFWGFEPVRTPLFGYPYYAVQALSKGFIDHVQDGLAQHNVNIVHLGLLIVELSRTAVKQWGKKLSTVLLHEYQFGQFDMGLVINGELLYTRYLEDISHLTTALLEAEERYDLYYPGQKMPADIPSYLTGRGPLSREIVLKPDLQLPLGEGHLLRWWSWPEDWAIENGTGLAHADEEGVVTEFRKEVEEHWSLLLARLAPDHDTSLGGGSQLWLPVALLVFALGAGLIAGSWYLARELQPAAPEATPPPVVKADIARQAKALGLETQRLEKETEAISHSLRPADDLLRALNQPLPARYRLESVMANSAREDVVHLLLAGPHDKGAQAQIAAHLSKLKNAQGKPLLRKVGPDPTGRALFRKVRPGGKDAQIYLRGELGG